MAADGIAEDDVRSGTDEGTTDVPVESKSRPCP